MFLSFLKYNFVQILAYGIELLVFFGVLWINAGLIVTANVSAKLSAGTFAFLSHKYFTFRRPDNTSFMAEAVRYAVLLGVSTVLSSGLLVAVSSLLPVWLSKPIVDIVTVGMTFLVTRHVVFRKRA